MDWGQEEKGMTEDEMVEWHHWLNGREFEWTLGDGEDREAWCAAVREVAKSQTQQRGWTTSLQSNSVLNIIDKALPGKSDGSQFSTEFTLKELETLKGSHFKAWLPVWVFTPSLDGFLRIPGSYTAEHGAFCVCVKGQICSRVYSRCLSLTIDNLALGCSGNSIRPSLESPELNTASICSREKENLSGGGSARFPQTLKRNSCCIPGAEFSREKPTPDQVQLYWWLYARLKITHKLLHTYMLSCFSHVWLCLTHGARQVPLSMGFCRQEYWSGLPCPPPGDLPDTGIKPVSPAMPALAGGFFTTSITWVRA